MEKNKSGISETGTPPIVNAHEVFVQKKDKYFIILTAGRSLFFFTLSRGGMVPPIQRRSRWRRFYARGERAQWPPSAAGDAAARRRGVSVPTDRGKRGRDTKVSLPLLTPQPFLWTRLPSVARLKARGAQGRLVLQGHILDRSGAFRSANRTPSTVWPRTVMRGG